MSSENRGQTIYAFVAKNKATALTTARGNRTDSDRAKSGQSRERTEQRTDGVQDRAQDCTEHRTETEQRTVAARPIEDGTNCHGANIGLYIMTILCHEGL